MSSKEVTKCDNSLDDSLTNIQWLCGLESSELLQARENAAQESISNAILPDSPNPYSKPPYSYATLILLAINSTDDKKMTLQDIYKWIETNYPYYQKCKKAWKNSIRHNLSLHSFFLKEKRPLDLPGKGSYWSISPEGKKNIMQEVMKHAQPIVQNPLAPNGQVCRNLRPILPKPPGEAQQYYDTVPGVCSFVNGKTVMPVVILPTNIYVELASKIANNKKNDLPFTVTQGQDSTIKVENNVPETQQDTNATGVVFSSLMEEILRNKNFSEALESIKNESLTTSRGNFNERQENFEPAIKKIKKENNLTPCPIIHVKKTPLKDRTLPTLAAINAAPSNDSGIFDKDYKVQDFTSFNLTPAHLSTPKGTIAASKSDVQSPSPLSTFHSGLTPLKYDSDSGFFTPLREADFDFLLSPNQLSLDQLTPARFNSTPQGCRKSLKLGTVHEEMTDSMTWMQ